MEDDFTLMEQDAWGGLLGMYGRLERRIDADLQRNFQISHGEFEVLLRLSWVDGGKMRIQDLAAKSLLTPSGMSRVVGRLEQAGLVKREGANEDRRGAYAVLTPAGRKQLRAALRAHVALVRRQFLSLFTERELEQMGEFWKRVEERAAEMPSSIS